MQGFSPSEMSIMKRMHLSITLISAILLQVACRDIPATFQPVRSHSLPGEIEISQFRNQGYAVPHAGTSLWVLDSLGSIQDSLPFTDYPARVTAFTDVRHQTGNFLFLMESGATENNRQAWKINLPDKKVERIDLTEFFERLKAEGIDAVQIEGVAATENGFMLINRGSEQFPKNHLIFTEFDFWKNPEETKIQLMLCGHSDKDAFSGISNIDYDYRSGHAYLSVSGGDGPHRNEIWMIPDILSKKNYAAINPHKILNLSKEFPIFKELKTTSVTVLGSTQDRIDLWVSAVDTTGKTKLFEVAWKK